jgi:hypothetical protein
MAAWAGNYAQILRNSVNLHASPITRLPHPVKVRIHSVNCESDGVFTHHNTKTRRASSRTVQSIPRTARATRAGCVSRMTTKTYWQSLAFDTRQRGQWELVKAGFQTDTMKPRNEVTDQRCFAH